MAINYLMEILSHLGWIAWDQKVQSTRNYLVKSNVRYINLYLAIAFFSQAGIYALASFL